MLPPLSIQEIGGKATSHAASIMQTDGQSRRALRVSQREFLLKNENIKGQRAVDPIREIAPARATAVLAAEPCSTSLADIGPKPPYEEIWLCCLICAKSNGLATSNPVVAQWEQCAGSVLSLIFSLLW
jgi:hypothetical protein